jgi:hypothetical protein
MVPGNILEGQPAPQAAQNAQSDKTGDDRRGAQKQIAHRADFWLTVHRRPEREEQEAQQRQDDLDEWRGPADPHDPTQETYVSLDGGMSLLDLGTTTTPFRDVGRVWHGKRPGNLCDFCDSPFSREGYGAALLNPKHGVRHACTQCQEDRFGFWDHNRDGTLGDDHDYLLITKDELADVKREVAQEVNEVIEQYRNQSDDDGPYTGKSFRRFLKQ